MTTETTLALDEITASLPADEAEGIDDVPAWLSGLVAAFDEHQDPSSIEAIKLAELHQALDPVTGEFLGLVEPILLQARIRLTSQLRPIAAAHPDLHLDPEHLLALVYPNIVTQVVNIIARSLVLELHAARERGELVGDTPEDRFNYFVQQLRDRSFAIEILRHYPVLARQVMLAIDQWRRFCAEFVQHFADDWNLVASLLDQAANPGELVEINGRAGDHHRGGRSVLLLRFESGQRLVYKPKSLAAEEHFQHLLAWLNRRGARPQFRPLRVLNRGDHGWVEFVAQESCQSRDQVERFYRRQGGYLALTYLLSATDLHFENLIAAGEHPALVDLEALFHQHLPGPKKDPASQGLSESVMATRMLPQLHYVEGVPEAIDFSGLGATPGQASPYLLPGWQHPGTDQMRLVMLRTEMPDGKHRPRLREAEVDFAEYEPALKEGFKDTYQLLARHREELLANDGPIAAFAEDEVRFIARPTQTYGIVIDQSFHPARLADEDKRRALLSRLEVKTREFPCLRRLLHAELADLDQNDIPVFFSRPGSSDLWTSTGERIANFFETPILELVRRRIKMLGPADLARQLWLIRTSLAMAWQERGDRKPAGFDPGEELAGLGNLAAPHNIGERLLTLSWQRGGQAGWLGLIERERGWSLGPLRCDLVDGLTGVALFLAHLGRTTRDDGFTMVAKTVVRWVVDRLRNHAEARMELQERPGEPTLTMKTLLHLARLWRDETLSADVYRLARELGMRVGDMTLGNKASLVDQARYLLETAMAQVRTLPLPPGAEIPGLRDGLAGRGLAMLLARE
jgi:type 2 lantibiotic biosynthesis protein LanM